MPAPGRDSLSDSDVRAILTSWKDLKPEDIDLYVSSGVGKTLIGLERSGFQCSEGDPLLLLCPDSSNYEASMAYLRGGNFALPARTPGQRPWPVPAAPANGTERDHLPAGVDASPPFALGRFINERFRGAVDKTEGTSMNVFYVRDLEVYSEICVAVVNSPQFGRLGRYVAQRFGVPEEPVLVRAFLLDRINGHPLAQPHFTNA